MNDNNTAPAAITPTAVFEMRFPIRPLMTNPIAGNSGMSQIRSKKFILVLPSTPLPSLEGSSCLPLHQIDFIDVHRFLVLEHRDHDPESYRCFGGSNSDDKNGENLTGHLL